MDCSMSDMLIMKYMDGEITESEAMLLNEHILQCEACRKEFYLFDRMTKGFESLPEIEAPEGFEMAVMAKIEALDYNYAKSGYSIERKILGVMLGVFSVAVAGGVALFVFREPILNSAFGGLLPPEAYGKLADMSGFISEFGYMCKDMFSNVLASANRASALFMGVVGLLVIAVAALQGYILYKKRR